MKRRLLDGDHQNRRLCILLFKTDTIDCMESDERGSSESSGKLEWEIYDAENLWNELKGGTKRFASNREGFVTIGPDLGNLGGGPQVRVIGDTWTFKFDLCKVNGETFYKAPDQKLLQQEIHASFPQELPEMRVDGVNVYYDAGNQKRRIAYRLSQREIIYDPGEGEIRNADELHRHLQTAALIYQAYVLAYYKTEGLTVPGDQLIFKSRALTLSEEASGHGVPHNFKKEEEPPKDMFLPEIPDVRFKDVGGQERAVTTCQRFAEQLHYREIFALQGSEPPRGILLWGPPGTGKTLLAKAIANEANANFLHIVSSDIVGQGLYGQAEKETQEIFNQARRLTKENGKHVIIYIDEGDLLLPNKGEGSGSRHEATGSRVGVFSQEMDGITSAKDITVIISTNEPKDLDPRILSRMDESEEVPLPDQRGLEQIFEIHLNKLNAKAGSEVVDPDIDKTVLAGKAFGFSFSGRDVADIIGIMARQRGFVQLTKIKEAIKDNRLKMDQGRNEREFIAEIAKRIRTGQVEGIQDLVLPPITTEDLLGMIENSKNLLKEKRPQKLGFQRNQ